MSVTVIACDHSLCGKLRVAGKILRSCFREAAQIRFFFVKSTHLHRSHVQGGSLISVRNGKMLLQLSRQLYSG
jgi:hypothetical protein